jgi:signal transduction histidine kinase
VDRDSDAQARQSARLAQWRAARLAALSLLVGRLGHDVRGALQPGLLMAERLRTSTDPLAVRVSDSVGRSVDRATELVRHTVEFAREGDVALPRELIPVGTLLADASGGPEGPGPLRIEAAIPEGLVVAADRHSAAQILAELISNAAAAGARTCALTAERAGRMAAICVLDDGPGLPPALAGYPFRPGAAPGGGLGLAIAHDLAVAQGGDLVLLRTGVDGTRLRLLLPLAAA